MSLLLLLLLLLAVVLLWRLLLLLLLLLLVVVVPIRIGEDFGGGTVFAGRLEPPILWAFF